MAAQDLERRNKLGMGHEVGGLDSNARIPWRPPTAQQVRRLSVESIGRAAWGRAEVASMGARPGH